MTRHLLLLSGIAVVAAVLNHAVGWGYTALFFWADRYMPVSVPDFSQVGSASYYGLRLAEQVVVAGVPAFLFVSGFFVAFAAGRGGRLSWTKVRARLRTLLVPYVIWTLAIFALRAADGTTDSLRGYAAQLAFGRAAPPYYYVPLLAQFYLLAPAVMAGLRRQPLLVLAAAGALQLVVLTARYPVWLGWDWPVATWIWRHSPWWFFPQAAFWFVLGAYVAVAGSTLRARLAAAVPALVVATGLLVALGIVEWEFLARTSGQPWMPAAFSVVDAGYSLAAVLTFLGVAERLRAPRPALESLGYRSYGVYLVHAPVLELVARACYHSAPGILAHQALLQPLLLATGLAVPLLLMEAVRRSPVRRSYNYLFG